MLDLVIRLEEKKDFLEVEQLTQKHWAEEWSSRLSGEPGTEMNLMR